jgi:osmotically-inducible protein OsmY
MRTDSELRADVLSELQLDASIRGEDIAVSVKDEVVTLAGTVDNYAKRYAAERAIDRVKGTRAIVNRVAVKLPDGLARTDAEIAHAALNALWWHGQVPEERICVIVSDGWLTLEGEVNRQEDKQAAENAVRYLLGLKGMTNLITLRPGVRLSDIAQRIRSSLKRQEEVHADQITVETSGSRLRPHRTGPAKHFSEAPSGRELAWSVVPLFPLWRTTRPRAGCRSARSTAIS